MISLSWVVAFLAVACSATTEDHLSAFMRHAGEDARRIETLRDALFGRVRCGAQQGLTDKLCRECLSAERISNMTVVHSTPVRVLSSTSYVFLNYFLTFRTSCTAESVRQGYVGSCRTQEECRTRLLHGYLAPIAANTTSLQERIDALERILREVKAVFEPDPSKPCFSAEMVSSELNTRSGDIASLPREDATVLLLTSHLYSGECIDVGESVADFLDDIFLHYGDGCERVMTQSGFSKLWNDLQMQRKGNHINHGVQKNSCRSESSRSTQDQMATDSTVDHDTDTSGTDDKGATTSIWTPSDKVPGHQSGTSDVENSTTLVVLMPHSHKAEEDSAWRSRVPAHSHHYVLGEEKNETEVGTSEVGTTGRAMATNSRRVRHTALSEDHEHKNLANECLPSDDLLQRFLSPGNQVITSSEFLQLCPALVQQAVSGVCSARLETTTVAKSYRSNDTVQQQVVSQSANPWFAVASVSLITAISLLGLFLLPVLKKSFFVHINAFFMGLAFGTMSGDVVMHLMPQYLGLHQHSEHSEQDHDSESTLDRLFPSHLQRQLAFLLTMYLLFLVECIFTAFTEKGGDAKKSHHGHSHGPVEINLRDLTTVGNVENGEAKIPKPEVSRCTRIVEFLKPSNLFTGMSSKAAVIVLADTVHNFADGMAIAVGFSTSYKDGFSTSVAVFFHELPHEIGDFAVLMNCGLSYWKAFVFNLLSGLSAFLGLGVGVFAASLFREWLLCITAGLFFFVVMAEMLPDMRLESKEKWPEFVVKVTGTVCGIGTMICIAMYELSTS